jgi:glycosyltransferase involved in cell wall biosynthesis
VNGFLAAPNSPQDFAQKVITILENPDLKNQLTAQARPSILEFDWSACTQKFENKLYELVNIRRKIDI